MTATTVSPEELLRLRVFAQGLSEPHSGASKNLASSGHLPNAETDTSAERSAESAADRIAATTRRMLALQGQDWRAVRWALGQRTPGTSVDDVHEAFNRGLVVRSWPMRGTVHVVAAEDIAWMQQATNRRVLAGAPKRREFLGMSDEVLERLVEVSLEALRGGHSYGRDEISALWTEAGIDWKSNWRYHLIWWLCQNGHAVFGPLAGDGEPRLVLASEWIAQPRMLSGDEALAELAARHASARGAVSAKDLAWWSGLTAGEAGRGLAIATETGRLVEIQLKAGADANAAGASTGKSVQLWADPVMLDGADAAVLRPWQLLPAFDEHLLGYQTREPQLAAEHFAHIVPGKNGMFLSTVVHDGRVVGTWKKGTRKGEGLVGTPLPGHTIDAAGQALNDEARRWGEFHGLAEVPFSVSGP